MKKATIVWTVAIIALATGTAALAELSGIGSVAGKATTNLKQVAQLITAAAYVAGMAFAVGAIVKFKAHKDNPTQIPIGTPIALLFVGAALIFAPTIFKVSGETLFGSSGIQGGVSGAGLDDFGKSGSGK